MVSTENLPSMIFTQPSIVIYGPAECPNCNQAMRLFDRNDIGYTKITIESGDENHRHITEDLGYSEAPVIVVTFAADERRSPVHWGGHRPDMLTGLTRLCRSQKSRAATS